MRNTSKDQKKLWFRRNPKTSLLSFAVLAGFVLLILVEIIMRLAGYQPGYMLRNNYFTFVDSLVVDHDYIADRYGINKVDPRLEDSLHHHIEKIGTDLQKAYSLNTEFTLQDLISEFAMLQYPEEVIDSFIQSYYHDPERQLNSVDSQVLDILTHYKTDFYYYIQALRQKDTSTLTEIEAAYLRYATYPINSDGFKSITFKNYHTNQPKVLLLGDSFTWGLSARPITNSFPELLAAKGYVVFNTGIVGADPAQYLAITEQYIERLRPDVVCVNFYTLNDVMHFHREMKPYQLHYYATSAGWLWACPKQEYLPDPETAYHYYEEHQKIPTDLNWFNALCSKTVLTTYLWQLLAKNFIIQGYSDKFAAYDLRNRDFYLKKSIAEEYLGKIKTLCDRYGSKFLLVLIPDYEQLGRDMDEVVNIKALTYHVPGKLIRSDYNPHPDGHFNNSGHRKYADFLDENIKKLLAEDHSDD